MTRASRKICALSALMLAALCAGPRDARSETLREAQQELAKARNTYFDTIHKMPHRTGDDEAKLYNQIVAPAEQNLSKAVSESLSASSKHIFAPPKKLKKGEKLPAPDASAAPELALDGKDVPKEVAFRGKAGKKRATLAKGKKTPSPTPAPEPSPAPSPALSPDPGASGAPQINEIEFKKRKSP